MPWRLHPAPYGVHHAQWTDPSRSWKPSQYGRCSSNAQGDFEPRIANLEETLLEMTAKLCRAGAPQHALRQRGLQPVAASNASKSCSIGTRGNSNKSSDPSTASMAKASPARPRISRGTNNTNVGIGDSRKGRCAFANRARKLLRRKCPNGLCLSHVRFRAWMTLCSLNQFRALSEVNPKSNDRGQQHQAETTLMARSVGVSCAGLRTGMRRRRFHFVVHGRKGQSGEAFAIRSRRYQADRDQDHGTNHKHENRVVQEIHAISQRMTGDAKRPPVARSAISREACAPSTKP